MLPEQQIQHRIENFPSVCRKAGLKVTPQRLAIFSMMTASDRHPSPEEVYDAIRETHPSISLATVYKILDLFHSLGYLRKVSTLDHVSRYDANVEPHHHAICSKCGKIRDVTLDKIPSQYTELSDLEGFQATDYEILFSGICAACYA